MDDLPIETLRRQDSTRFRFAGKLVWRSDELLSHEEVRAFWTGWARCRGLTAPTNQQVKESYR